MSDGALTWKYQTSVLNMCLIHQYLFASNICDTAMHLSLLLPFVLTEISPPPLFQNYGTIPSMEELKELDHTCPICQDNITDPVKLSCRVR